MDGSGKPYPKNAPGPFYVVDGCCLTCGVPHGEAPDLFAFDDHHCYVQQQPRTDAEMDQMLEAVRVADLSCIRYRGNDPAVFERLGAMGDPDCCDFPPPEGIRVILRNVVAFETAGQGPIALDDVVADFRSFWMQMKDDRSKFRALPRGPLDRTTSFEFAWNKDDYHRVDVAHDDGERTRTVMFHSPVATSSSRAISALLSWWLKQSDRFVNQQWYTNQQWVRRAPGSPKPW